MKTLAIDYGLRRVGLAISDDEGGYAFPLDVLTVSDPDDAIETIVTLCQSEGVRQLVVGMPLNMDGSVGGAGRAVQAWARRLSGRVGLPTTFVDERLSSFEAEQQLIEHKRKGAKLTRSRKKRQLDAQAARVLLESYLRGEGVVDTNDLPHPK